MPGNAFMEFWGTIKLLCHSQSKPRQRIQVGLFFELAQLFSRVDLGTKAIGKDPPSTSLPDAVSRCVAI